MLLYGFDPSQMWDGQSDVAYLESRKRKRLSGALPTYTAGWLLPLVGRLPALDQYGAGLRDGVRCYKPSPVNPTLQPVRLLTKKL